MQILIDIPEDDYKEVLKDAYSGTPFENRVFSAIQNGTPIPDNATNGEIMQMMFPNGVMAKFATFMRFVVGEDEYINCAYDWWNAPYQKGGKE